jgi:hypothetical protein
MRICTSKSPLVRLPRTAVLLSTTIADAWFFDVGFSTDFADA